MERCRELGADLAISYRDDDFVAAVQDFTGGRGADVILDIMGAKYLEPNIRSLAYGGRLVVIGMQGGTTGKLDLRKLASRQGTVLARLLRPRSVEEKGRIMASVREEVWPLIAAKKVSPIVYETLPLAEVQRAHLLMESSAHIGKILLAT
jgi:NADPH:quinone reductase-like Zn-dependent oxidoreductase